MKRILLSAGILLASFGAAMAQEKAQQMSTQKSALSAAPAKPTSTLTADNMQFVTKSHDFGTIPEGPAANFEFHFTNTGKEPIVIQKVQASCGCTTPSYSKDPVLPGKEGIIKASFNTNGRPNAFTKSVTVLSNAGTTVLTIKGNVEKAPSTSVPEATSMIKTN
jgi:hypothetical protein